MTPSSSTAHAAVDLAGASPVHGWPHARQRISEVADRAPAWIAWSVIGAGGVLRLYGAADWSLWDDEQTTMFFALHPNRTFPSAFPLFFRVLGGLFGITGVSVVAGRLLVAAIGTLTLWLAYLCARQACGQRVALGATALIALSPGHLFWSQSIRYYMPVLMFQLVSIWFFFRGLDTHRLRWFAASALGLLLAVSSHYSAALLAPVYALALFTGEVRHLSTRRRWLVLLGLGAAAASALGFLSDGFGGIRHLMDGGIWVWQFPHELLIAMAFYFGAPAVLLGALALVMRRPAIPRFRFFVTLSLLIPFELIVIRYLGVMFYVLWYYALVSLLGVAVLAAWCVSELALTAPRLTRMVIVPIVVAVYAICLVAYYGPAHGDRPRWKDAAAFLDERIGPKMPGAGVPVIYAGAPGVIAYYLGVPAGETMGFTGVQELPRVPLRKTDESWYVVESRVLEPGERDWYDRHCRLEARFESRMLVRDRTLEVHHCGERP
jgi:4-amino-4-deoxy-L-arabinose transferase-like glycosyltransferase